MFDCSGVKVPVHGLMEWTGIAQIHLAIRPRRAVLPEPIEAGPVAPAQFHHSFDCQSPAGLHLFPDLPVDRVFPGSACSIRYSSMRSEHPCKKSISRACRPTLRSNSAIRPSGQRGLPLPGRTFPGPWRNSLRQRCNTLGFTSHARGASLIDSPFPATAPRPV